MHRVEDIMVGAENTKSSANNFALASQDAKMPYKSKLLTFSPSRNSVVVSKAQR